jgi:ferrochelatase
MAYPTRCSSEQNARKGIKKLAVVTPAFVSDCLETLEEIAMELITNLKYMAVKNSAVPCLNGDEWCKTVSNWITEWVAVEKTNV